MSGWDLLVRGGRVAGPDGGKPADLAVEGGRIAAMAAGLGGGAARTIDAAGCWIFPGLVDAHVHFNEPGRTDWEGIDTGSLALAAGGGTVFVDMPLNSEPPAVRRGAFDEKRRIAEAKARVDFGLWGGLVPGNEDDLGRMAEAGAAGFKAFLCGSGISSFPRADAATLKAGMRRAAELGLPVGVHAEDEAITARLTAAAQSAGRRDVRAYLESRPIEAEVEAIRLAVRIAGETRCRLQVVHVTCPEGLDAIAEGRRQGADVTAETCPHYLLLNDRDVERIGALAKCSPPIRDETRRRELWRRLRRGEIDTIGSDHSPAPGSLKAGDDFFAIWGGIAGIRHGAELLLSESDPSADWPILAAALASAPARRFGFAGKGALAVGCDADFSIVAVGPPRIITAEELPTRHRLSPYVGRTSRIRFTRTILRGETVWPPPPSPPRGRFLRPDIR